MKITPAQKQFILAYEKNDVHRLAFRFQEKEDISFLLNQISGRQTVKNKLPSWYSNEEIIYPAHLSLEQASSEATARYKASVIGADKIFVDLTGGLGVDFSFLSPQFSESVYVEQNRELCKIAVHNFKALNLKNVSVINSTSEKFLKGMGSVEFIYLDPSRRDGAGRKTVRMEDCTPDVLEIQNMLLAKSKLTLVKFSPMLDISSALKNLKSVCEVHVVSVDNECKELLFILSGKGEECLYKAVNLRKDGKTESFTFYLKDEQEYKATLTSQPGKYLYEPNASILKIGAFNLISKVFDVKKLHKNTHLYTSDELVSSFPGRIFEVQNWFSPNKKNLKSFLSETKKANVSIRNFPVSVAEIRRKTGLKEGGDLYLFATTVADGERLWVETKRV